MSAINSKVQLRLVEAKSKVDYRVTRCAAVAATRSYSQPLKAHKYAAKHRFWTEEQMKSERFLAESEGIRKRRLLRRIRC